MPSIQTLLLSLLLCGWVIPATGAPIPVSAPSDALLAPAQNPTNPASAYWFPVKQLLDALEEEKVAGFGCREQGAFISIATLRNAIREVEIVEVDHFSKPAGAKRWSAFYSPREKRVYINRADDPFLQLDSAGALALHELLGVAGFPDLDYQATILSNLVHSYRMSYGPRGQSLEMAFPGIKELFENVLCNRYTPPDDPDRRLSLGATAKLSGGGGDIVGGGGSSEALDFKIALVRQALLRVALPIDANDLSKLIFLRVEAIHLLRSGQDDLISYEIHHAGERISLPPPDSNPQDPLYRSSELIRALTALWPHRMGGSR